MCIRDRVELGLGRDQRHHHLEADRLAGTLLRLDRGLEDGCLLYTSDAADERSSVDLGGRRIIKKNKQKQRRRKTHTI